MACILSSSSPQTDNVVDIPCGTRGGVMTHFARVRQRERERERERARERERERERESESNAFGKRKAT